mmetsp:Transcript_13715/g.20955  ORF Transcript_13715/g.20955 Transcript_13715/m.20955 type:complete len:287 (-) Transcript_13715:1465-2325(-)
MKTTSALLCISVVLALHHHQHKNSQHAVTFVSAFSPTATTGSRRSRAIIRNRCFQRNSKSSSDVESEMAKLERTVKADTQERLDLKAVTNLSAKAFDTGKDTPESIQQEIQNPWKVSIAAGAVAFFASLTMSHSVPVAGLCFGAAFFAAQWDPVDEDSVAGPIARTVGRNAIRAQPKIKAVAKAAMSDVDEVNGYYTQEMKELRERVRALERENQVLAQENEEYRLKLARRDAVDRSMSSFNLDELKDMARTSGVPLTGTKAELMMRLIEAEVIVPKMDVSKKKPN